MQLSLLLLLELLIAAAGRQPRQVSRSKYLPCVPLAQLALTLTPASGLASSFHPPPDFNREVCCYLYVGSLLRVQVIAASASLVNLSVSVWMSVSVMYFVKRKCRIDRT